MQANLTRGNSITENYVPYTLEDVVRVLSIAQINFAKPVPKFKDKPGGFTIIGERGMELVDLKSGSKEGDNLLAGCKIVLSPFVPEDVAIIKQHKEEWSEEIFIIRIAK